ncbi:hypothetical protein [Bradyrhizobium sp. CCBAU 51753]|uniref:hypothetical protein n=1 Tax=Bradyrhizobium sp. CCBAU 51753 TaxID=1325100 RepID=UPI00188BB7BC|nr:hypothetical protein [Bradyrhizobium sp. CCBAU 51753]QOZ24144.1 hypothetical protein XH93_11580 [Bradyrhizobium sp. CCBAU 51753]
MPHDPQHEVWNPFCERIILGDWSRDEILDMERGAAWAAYINGGVGEPYHFDYLTWLKMQERSR